MCGIFGIKNLTKQAAPINKDLFIGGLQVIAHRGPDAEGVFMPNDEVILGHRRLSIIDLSTTNNQPFIVNERYSVIYNGEIYNYLELKNELLALGHSFITEGDTEVLVKAYIQWGVNCVKKFNGMWSFALYDNDTDILFCSRDRFGVKPFNYSINNHQFIFASEIKSIITYQPNLKKPNFNVIANYCRTGLGAQAKETWFQNILRLPPAHNLLIKENTLIIEQYWDYPTKTNRAISFEEAQQQYLNIFIDAVKLRMRSDVPVGTTLSSGLDSTSVVAALRTFFDDKHQTYTAVFDNKEFENSEKNSYKNNIEINEAAIVHHLAKDLNLEDNYVKFKDEQFVQSLAKIIFHLESGHSSPAIIPLDFVMQRAAQDVKVVLEGQGADELLGGYTVNLFFEYLLKLFTTGKFITAWNEFKKFRRDYSFLVAFKMYFRLLNSKFIQDFFFWWNDTQQIFGSKLKKYKLLTEHRNEGKRFDCSINKLLYYQHTGGLVNLLHYGDAISMTHSIESRLPFMDYRLVEFVFTMPYNFKLQNGFGKYLHRKAVEQIVPDYIRNNSLKFGFTTPLSKHFMSDDNEALSILLSQRCLSREIFDKEGLEKIVNKHQAKKADYSRLLFRLLSVELWFQKFID